MTGGHPTAPRATTTGGLTSLTAGLFIAAFSEHPFNSLASTIITATITLTIIHLTANRLHRSRTRKATP